MTVTRQQILHKLEDKNDLLLEYSKMSEEGRKRHEGRIRQLQTEIDALNSLLEKTTEE